MNFLMYYLLIKHWAYLTPTIINPPLKVNNTCLWSLTIQQNFMSLIFCTFLGFINSIGRGKNSKNEYTLVAADTYCETTQYDKTHRWVKTLEECQGNCDQSEKCRALIYVKKWKRNCYLLTEACPKHHHHTKAMQGSKIYSKN